MNIGIGYYMRGSERGGIDWSITELLPELLRAGARHTFTVFTNMTPEAIAGELGRPANLRVVSFRMTPYSLWEQVGLALAIARERPTLFHSPAGLPLLSATPGIATIHDLCFVSHPETYTRKMRMYFEIFFRRSARRARLVVTVSDASRRRVVEVFGIPENNVRVVPNGVGADFQPVGDAGRLNEVRARYGLPERFILHVGTREPRKNLVTLLRACQALWSSGRTEKLVLVGKRGWLSQPIEDFVADAGLEPHVVFAGYVPRQDLPAVYSAAAVFVFPSLCEGFGLPPVEAMACGTPVVASNAPAHPEVLGTAARLVDPQDDTALAAAIRDVLDDDTLRRQLRAAGLDRAARYRWDTAARRLIGLYEEVAAHAN